jgi:subtilisin family serine protease
VRLAIADSGVDLAHPDLPQPVEAYDMTDGTSVSSWGTDVSNTVTGHGTHVSGSAVGSGSLSGSQYRGAAPGADYYFYKIGDDTTSVALDTDSIEAVNRALLVGCDVFSMSYGGFSVYMDGSSSLCQAVDAAVAAGMMTFFSAGNEALTNRHYSVSTGAGTPTVPFVSASFGYTVDNTSGTTTLTGGELLRVLWQDSATTDFNISLSCSNLGPGESLSIFAAGTSSRGTEGRGYFLYPSIAPGASKTYQLTISNVASDTPLVHVYRRFSSDVGTFVTTDSSATVTHPGLADSAIAVANWSQRSSWLDSCGNLVTDPVLTVGTLAGGSSRGPRIDGLLKPDLGAPGSKTISTRDVTYATLASQIIDDDGLMLDCSGPANYYTAKGTSMAAPMAAGSAALILEADPSLTPAQVLGLMTSTASSAATPDNDSGFGLIDVLAAIQGVGPTAAVNVYGCGTNPPGSMTVVSGIPQLGATVQLGLDNPLGTQAAGSLPVLVLAFAPATGFPCGIAVPGMSMAGAGAAGELLISLTPPSPLLPFLVGTPWSGAGSPTPIDVSVPDDCTLLGVSIYAQGVLLDTSPGASVPLGLTEAAQITIGS